MLHAVEMGALHAMGGVDAGADEGAPGVVARLPESGHVGAVMRINIHGVVHAVGAGQLHQPGHHTVVIGAVVVLGADGHLVLRAVQVLPDAPHVHRQQLVHRRHDAAAVTDLLVYSEAELRVVPGGGSRIPQELEQREQARGAALIVDEAGL